jgi:nucleoside-diphosphate-sugar epimerase
MRLMVIGANGFLGTHVRHQAQAAGIEVITAGRPGSTGSCSHQQVDLARDTPARIACVIADAAPDAVVNCAGATTGAPDALVAANVTSAFALAKAMLLVKTVCPAPVRLIHLGSAAEYGRTEPGVVVSERTTPRPAAMYGVTKLAGTRLVELAVAAGLDAVVLRVFNPVGPGAPLTSLPGRLVAELRRALQDSTEVQLGPLDTVRDFVDPRDVADAVLAAAAAPIPPRHVLNIGSGLGVPVRTVVKELCAISGYAASVHEDGQDVARPVDIPWQRADINCAAEDLGWRPRRDLVTSLTDLWEASA